MDIGHQLTDEAHSLPVQLLQLLTGLSGEAGMDVHARDVSTLVLLPQSKGMAVHLPIGGKILWFRRNS